LSGYYRADTDITILKVVSNMQLVIFAKKRNPAVDYFLKILSVNSQRRMNVLNTV